MSQALENTQLHLSRESVTIKLQTGGFNRKLNLVMITAYRNNSTE